ncbi:MAG TPA: regulatory protein GemA [Thermoanaerobaculia bacterium]|nr:regulatory protein GemA [Thermoanaerobaculia bacterium]
MDDDDWRSLLRAEAGVDTSKDLDNAGMNRVLKRLKKLGFKNTAHRPRRREPNGVITPFQQRMIEDNHARLGFDTSTRRMGFNKRVCGKAFPQTRTEAAKVIEAQNAMLQRGWNAGAATDFSTSAQDPEIIADQRASTTTPTIERSDA